MKTISSILILAILSVNAFIQQKLFTECDNCNSLQYKNAALDRLMFGEADVYVYDWTREVIKKYFVEKEFEPGSILVRAVERPVEPAIRDDFNIGNHAIRSLEIPATLRPIVVDPNVFGSAYDVVNDSNAQAQLVDVWIDTSGITWVGDWLGGALISITTKLANLSPVVHFAFADGSLIVFRVVHFDPTGLSVTFEFVRGTDADGNAIHDNSNNYIGDTGVISSGSPLIGHWQSLGLIIFFNQGSGGNCDWECGAGKCTLTCPD